MYSRHLARYVSLVVVCILAITVGSVAPTDSNSFDAKSQAEIARRDSGHKGQAAVELLRSHGSAGDVLAKRELGRCYEFGWSVEQNPKTATQWYLAAVAGGDVDASLRLCGFGIWAALGQSHRNVAVAIALLLQAERAGECQSGILAWMVL